MASRFRFSFASSLLLPSLVADWLASSKGRQRATQQGRGGAGANTLNCRAEGLGRDIQGT